MSLSDLISEVRTVHAAIYRAQGEYAPSFEDKQIADALNKYAAPAVTDPPKTPSATTIEKKLDAQTADSGDNALAGPDGRKVDQLLATSQKVGVATLASIMAPAVKRLLDTHQAGSSARQKVLFTTDERQKLADALAATNATSDLLGRSKVRLRMERVQQRAKAFAEFEAFCMTGENAGKPGPCPDGGTEPKQKAATQAPQATAKNEKLTSEKEVANQELAAWEKTRQESTNRFKNVESSDLIGRQDNFRRQLKAARADNRQEDVEKWASKINEAESEIKSRKEYYGIQRKLEAINEGIATGKLTVTESEMAKLLSDQRDAYRDAGIQPDRGRYPHTPEVFHVSDLTGAKMRHYVVLPDGRKAHPDELIEARRRGRLVVVGAERPLPARDWKTHAEPFLSNFSDTPTPFEIFDDTVIRPLVPEQAVAYFKSLVPTLNVDPAAYSAIMQREAFTLAVATEKTLLANVQRTIATALETGAVTNTFRDIQSILDAAGVSPANPQYSEMVFRTNMMDSYAAGTDAARQDPDVQEMFPVWRYAGIRDGRQGKDHEPKFDKFYPIDAAFTEVRGDRPFNCRCNSIEVDKFEWEKLQAAGARVEESW